MLHSSQVNDCSRLNYELELIDYGPSSELGGVRVLHCRYWRALELFITLIAFRKQEPTNTIDMMQRHLGHGICLANSGVGLAIKT